MLRIRDAAQADVPALEALERQCFSLPWSREVILSQLTDGSHVMLAAEEDGTFAGYMGMMFVAPEGYISNVCTDPAFRGRGVATALIGEMRRRALALGLTSLTLEARESNLTARALYEKAGFEYLGKRPGYYEQPREDAVIMTLYF